jgi:hypothetical protein
MLNRDRNRRTGRTTRMLLEALQLAGKNGVTLIVGANEQNCEQHLIPLFCKLAEARGLQPEIKPGRRNEVVIGDARFVFMSQANEKIATRGMRYVGEFWDHYAHEFRWDAMNAAREQRRLLPQPSQNPWLAEIRVEKVADVEKQFNLPPGSLRRSAATQRQARTDR